MNSVRSNNLSFTTPGWIDVGIRKLEFVSKTPFLSVGQGNLFKIKTSSGIV